MQPISITAISSISPLGISLEETWQNYLLGQHMFTKKRFSGTDEWVASLSNTAIQEIETLRNSDTKYKKLDNSVLFALYASRKAIAQAQWKSEADFGINIGSSRGATTLFEKYHSEFLEDNKTNTLASDQKFHILLPVQQHYILY